MLMNLGFQSGGASTDFRAKAWQGESAGNAQAGDDSKPRPGGVWEREHVLNCLQEPTMRSGSMLTSISAPGERKQANKAVESIRRNCQVERPSANPTNADIHIPQTIYPDISCANLKRQTV
jgi:hypothetical protein